MTFTRKILKNIKPYQPGKRISEVKREVGLEELVKLSSNESPYPPLKKAQKAMREAVKGINRYPDSSGFLLKEKIARHWQVDLANLVLGNGSNELIRLLAQVVLEPDDEVIMGWPSFIVYPLVTELMQAVSVKVPLKNFAYDLKAMLGKVTSKTKIVFICNPNNPTGTIVRRRQILSFMKEVSPRVIVAFDEAYYEYVDDKDYLSGKEIFNSYPNIVVFRTFSKIYGMAGARIGYALANSEVVEAIDKAREPFNVNMIAQIGAFYSLDGGEEVALRKGINLEEKRFLYQTFDRLGIKYIPSEANFIYAQLGENAREAFEKLKNLGIIVRAFDDSPYARITIGKPRENRRLIQALESLKA